MHCPPVPSSPVVRQDALRVQSGGNLGFQLSVSGELCINPPNDFDLLVRSGHQHNAVGLDALLFAHFQLAFFHAVGVHQNPAQPVTRRAALPESKFHQPARPLINLRRKFPAVFTRHRPLDALDNGGDRAAVIFKLFRAVVNRNARLFADVFVIGAFVGILKSAPPAHVINQNGFVMRFALKHITDHLFQRTPAFDV